MTRITNAALLARRELAVPRGIGSAMAVFAAQAENAEVHDVEGRRFIDFAGGIAVLNVGHRHPEVIAAVRRQLDRFTHTAFQVMPYEPYIALCERLNALAPFSGGAKTLLLNTGGEAVENAVKIARAFTDRSAVIAFAGAFHGRTLLASSMTGKVTPYKRGFGAMVAEVFHAPYPIPHHGVTTDAALQQFDLLLRSSIDPARVAAVAIEPILGEGGFYAAPAEFMAGLRARCDEYGILLIVDEVQTGFARTGRMFAIEHSGIEPDLVATAKSLGGGFPIAAVIGRSAVMDHLPAGGLGSTYGGHPVSCAAALATIEIIERDDLLARSLAIGERIKARVAGISRRNDAIGITAVRGPGAMVGFDVVERSVPYKPDAAATTRLTRQAHDRGLILLSCGIFGNAVRILVPLTASDEIIDEGLDRLEDACVAANAN